MEGFEGEEEQFILDVVMDGEPVEVLEDGGDVVVGMGLGAE